jgi:CheY-like chemotaxis protein
MTRQFARCLLAVAVALVALCPASGQPARAKDKDSDPEDYRRFFKTPETTEEFWKALSFEIEVGRYDLAAKHLRGLLAKVPSDDDLVALSEKYGTIAFLKLRNIRRWSSNAKDNAQALKDVEDLISKITAATRRKRADPVRIKQLIRQLSATREERIYAVRELYKSGAAAVPYLLQALRSAESAADRMKVLDALERMGPEAIPPMLATLDGDDDRVKIDVLNILKKRHVKSAAQIIPHLWFPSASPAQPAAVRSKAREVLAYLLDVPVTRLTPAKLALTREAEKFYQHKVTFPDPKAVVVWRWDDKSKNVVQGWPKAPTISASQAEEYWGLRFAREALTLNPGYRPAQVVLLSLAVEKAMDKHGVTQPLSRTAPEVNGLLVKSSADLLLEVLERAIKEQRTPLVLAVVRALGDRAEARARRPTGRGDPALVQALYYPDPRVQFAAVEALLRIPGTPTPKSTLRIVEILGRALTPTVAARPGPKVLVAVADEDWRGRVRLAVEETGAHPVAVATGKEAMRELRKRGDIQAILLDSTLPYPGLTHLLAQLRADVDVGKVPVLLAAIPETRVARDAARRYQVVRKRLNQIRNQATPYLDTLRMLAEQEAERIAAVKGDRALDTTARAEEIRKVENEFNARRRVAEKKYPEEVKLLEEVPKLEKELDALADRYELESRVREDALKRYVARYQNVEVVHAGLLVDGKLLANSLKGQVRDAGVALTPAEQADFAERSVRLLAALARGTPAGYDVTPAGKALRAALRAGRLSPEGQIAAITALDPIGGADTQADLAAVILDAKRPVAVRSVATAGLIRHVQKFGVLLTAAQAEPLRTLARQEKLDAGLKGQLAALVGVLKPDPRTTGERLRGYRPTPVPVVPPPKEE